ncbi:NADPH dehydrogenase NamA [Lysinibacillus sp. KU-BSD001]|uniref:NADPH dehydrogenase NamA n=1 Tax=Lysinibacillus sp. KU-BSD001 TaxID=3141328 RepID=UPI0036E7F9FA
MVKLFEPYKLRNIELKNRIVMAPMCMYEANEFGFAQPFHIVHYASRAMGQVGLVMLEATAILPEGRISARDLGIWRDEQLEGLKQIVDQIHAYGSKAAIQLAHAGRKATVEGPIYAPSAIAFDDTYQTPVALTAEQIKEIVHAFVAAAQRAINVGFDVLEIHGAHGYLISEFLSPLTNKREDAYGGSPENRYRLLREVIDGIRAIWNGPLLVRVSAKDYVEGGNNPEDFIQFAAWMKAQDVDLIDVSSGGVVPATIAVKPLYQVPFAETIRQTGMPTGAVGLITTGHEAEEVLQKEQADLIFIGRELLRDPYFPYRAAKQLGVAIDTPSPTYKRGW